MRTNSHLNNKRLRWRVMPGTWLTTASVGVAIPLGWDAPASWGWENGPVEWAQVIVLAAVFFAAIGCAIYGAGSYNNRRLWAWTSPVWLIIIGRELNWGRVFYPVRIGSMGPEFISRTELWYGPIIYPCIGLIIVGMAWGLYRTKLYGEIRRWLLVGRIPAFDLIVLLSSILFSVLMEKKVFNIMAERALVLEEIGELVMYVAILSIVATCGYSREFQSPPYPIYAARRKGMKFFK